MDFLNRPHCSQLNTVYFISNSVKAIFEEKIQILPRVQKTKVIPVRDAVKKFIYPHIKLLNYKDKEIKE